MRWVLARYLEDRPNSCLGIENNRVVFLLLTLKGDLEWRNRVDELHPWGRDSCLWGRCCWCDCEPVRMSVVNLINYLRLEGPHDLERMPTASEEDAPSPGEGDSKKEGGDPY